jgi:hypothetical protein
MIETTTQRDVPRGISVIRPGDQSAQMVHLRTIELDDVGDAHTQKRVRTWHEARPLASFAKYFYQSVATVAAQQGAKKGHFLGICVD